VKFRRHALGDGVIGLKIMRGEKKNVILPPHFALQLRVTVTTKEIRT